jgi:phage FluMu gp28-like protein
MSNVPTITLSKPHPKQREIIDAFAAHRFGVVDCGRRFGKTELGKIVAIQAALTGQIVWWILPTYPMARDTWGDLKRTLQSVTRYKSEVDRHLELFGGGVIRVQSGHDPDTLRGAGIDLAVLDEAAYLHPDVWSAAIRPALSDRRGKALFLSTPNGQNWFWSLWLHGCDPVNEDWFARTYTTADNPYIHPDEIAAARDLLPERVFNQEYLADFLSDGGAVFRNIAACATLQPGAQPEPHGEYIFGVDWARSHDFTVIAVMNRRTNHLVHIERFNQISWSLQRGRLRAMYERWRPQTIIAEENSIGGPNIEALQREGLPVQPFTTTAQSKGPLIESLALAFEKEEISIVNDPVLVGELQAYTLERLPSGRYRYNAPDGMHDDCVIATALAWHGAAHRRGWRNT